MRIALRGLVLCLLLFVGLGCWSAGVSQAASDVAGSEPASLGEALVVPGVETLDQGQQALAAEEARRSSPAAVLARELSRTRFGHLNAEQARQAAAAAFPETVTEPAGGPPKLPAGQKIVGYPRDNVATVSLSDGKHAVIESTQALAIETSRGHRQPTDLRLHEVRGQFEAERPAVGIVIPKRVSNGVRLSRAGVSLTPVSAAGVPLQGSGGVVDGASVVYANTQTDSDTLAKATPNGFETDVLLRSIDSPDQLFFRVGMPAGARLVQACRGSGTVRVMLGNTVLASISPPAARDAAGAAVPVSMRAAGGKLLLRVNARSDEYQYPIMVDPTVGDGAGAGPASNFHFIHEGAKFTAEWVAQGEGWIWHEHVGEAHKAGEWGALAYTTQGDSAIESLSVDSWWPRAGSHLENSLLIVSPKGEVEASWYNIERKDEELNRSVHTAPEPRWNNSAEVLTESNGEGEGGEQTISGAGVKIFQETHPVAEFNTSSPTIAGQPNVMYGTSNWLGPKSGAFEAQSFDEGIGVGKLRVHAGSALLFEKELWGTSLCAGIQCPPSFHETLGFNSAMPDGEVLINDEPWNVLGLGTRGEQVIKVDTLPPSGITLTGLGSGNEIGEGEYTLKAEATDSQSGVKAIALSLDGREIGSASGSCAPGPCTGKAQWQINGGEFGAGEHKIQLTATDNVGNVGSESIAVKIHHAAPIAVGPGAVDSQSGELTLSTTDVSVASPGANLEVARAYRSRHLTAGMEGPVGPQWSLSLGGQESLTKQPNGNATLTAASGGETSFVTNGKGGFVSPTGDANLALTEGKNEKGELTEFVLKDAANGGVTRFTSTEGSTASLWRPTKQEGPLPSETVRYGYETSAGITRPIYALAPEPAGVTGCLTRLEKKEELVAGCRALEFKYATSKTATGEAPKEWGDYIGRLKEIILRAYNPATKAMAKTPVADYKWDKQGRLRAEWDPQIEHELKITYGYDSENHVTAESPPGQQPWLIHYGTISSDASTGRLLSVIRPSAATELSTASAPEIKTVPTLSTTHPVIGTTLSVTNGSWGNSPLSYGYQWERCNSAGAECVAILGATNQTYTPIMGDYAHTLVAQVTATNANGSTIAASAASSVVPIAPPAYSSTFGASGSGAGQFAQPTAAAVAANGNVWVVDAGNRRLEEFSPSGTFVEGLGLGVSSGEETFQTCTSTCKAGIASESGFDRPEGIAINQTTGYIYVSDAGNNHIWEFAPSGKLEWSFGYWGEHPLSSPHGIAIDSSGDLLVADTGANKIVNYKLPFGEINATYGTPGKGLGQFQHLSGLAFAGGNLYATDSEKQSVQELKPSTGEWVREFGNTGSETEKVSDPSAIATDEPDGDLYVASYATGRIQAFTQEGKYVEAFGKAGSEREDLADPAGVAINPTSGAIYVGDEGNNRVDVWAPTGPTEEPIQPPPTLGTSAVTTIDYQVPLSGSELPTMTKAEVAKWGQSDVPVEATAIFPPDKPMGWPANAYKRATIDYLDSQGRTVNTASPTGGVSTSEYNKYNDVTRSLSPDNRAAALKEGCVSESSCKSAETSKLLDTQSTYEEGGSEPGTELLSTLGPQHTISLPNGTQVEARAHTVDSYNEGAPAEGGPYHLVTKTTQGAVVAGKEESETVRTSVMSYTGSGSQEGLGWKLRKPISVTTDPSGVALVHTTELDPHTGEVVQTKTPAAAGKDAKVPATYTAQFGAKGTGAGQLEQPAYDAIDAHGNDWVVEYGSNRLSEFSPSGAFIETVGWGVSNGEAKLEVCTASCKAGIAGTGKGQLEGPDGIAIAGGDIYVADTGNDRIEVLNEKGEWVTQWGSLGTGAGQFKNPLAIAVSPTGKVWVGDSLNRRVQEFSSTGTFIEAIGWGVSNGKAEYQVCTSSCRAGTSGSGNGQFYSHLGNGVRRQQPLRRRHQQRPHRGVQRKKRICRPVRLQRERQRPVQIPHRDRGQPHHRPPICHRHEQQPHAGVHAVRQLPDAIRLGRRR